MNIKLTHHPTGITVSNREVPVDTEVILTCSVSGFSGTPKLEWTLGNRKLEDDNDYTITNDTQGGGVVSRPIRARYLGHVTGYQPISIQY